MQTTRRDLARYLAFGAAAIVSAGSGLTGMSTLLAFAPGKLTSLRDEWKRAARRGRPLLVAVVPDNDFLVGSRTNARLLGRWLKSAEPARALDLARIDIACAKLADLRSLGAMPVGKKSDGEKSDGEPARLGDEVFLALLRADGDVTTVAAIEVSQDELERVAAAMFARDSRTEADLAADASLDPIVVDSQKLLAKVLGRFDTLVRGEIGAVDSTVEDAVARRASLAAAARAALSDSERAHVDAAPEDGVGLDDDLVDRAASILLARAATANATVRTHLEERLAKRVRARFVDAAPPGADWVTDGSCGSIVLSDGTSPPSLIACGMGLVSGKQETFLYYLTESDRKG